MIEVRISRGSSKMHSTKQFSKTVNNKKHKHVIKTTLINAPVFNSFIADSNSFMRSI